MTDRPIPMSIARKIAARFKVGDSTVYLSSVYGVSLFVIEDAIRRVLVAQRKLRKP